MGNYEKPIVQVVTEKAEGVFMASGDEQAKAVCRFGRTEANAGVDTCQYCSKSGGLTGQRGADGEGAFRSDYQGCPDNMPEKQ